MAYVRKKKVKGYEYYQLVEGRRESGKVRQRVLFHLGPHATIQEAAAAYAASDDVEDSRKLLRLADVVESLLERGVPVPSGAEKPEPPKDEEYEKLWRVGEGLKDSKGLQWVKQEFACFDFSGLEWITLRRGAWGGPGTKYAAGWTNPVHGLCQYPNNTKSGKYRVNCSVNTRLGWPAPIHQTVSPLYRNADGSWPPVPGSHTVGQWFVDEKSGREWKRLHRLVPINDEAEAVVYIVAHELFHYLRKTRQIDGRNTEIEADAFSAEALERYRRSAV